MKIGCSYFGNRILKHVTEDMKELVDMGCTYVVHTYNENDLTFYRKTIGEMVRASQDLGLEVHVDPWGVGKVFGGESFSGFVMANHDALQVASDGKPVGCACPNQPKFRKFMHDWVDAAVETGAEVLFWDEPHFYLAHWIGGRPNTWGCLCGECRRLFEERMGKPMPDTETEEVKEFKSDCLYEFLTDVIGYAAQQDRKNCLCVLPPRGKAAESESGVWERLSGIKGLDIFGTDPYWIVFKQDLEEFVGRSSRQVMELCRRKGLKEQVWLQGYGTPAGRENELLQAVQVMYREGVRDVAVWGFDACKHISWIRPDNPDLVWAKTKEAFAWLKSQKD
jgi:hypothetical protein